MWRAGRFVAILGLGWSVVMPAVSAHAAAPCTVCVVTVQTSGSAGADTESQDVVAIANRSAANVTSVQLRYLTASGVLSEASSLNIGTVNAGSTRVFVAPALMALNPNAESLKTLQLASAGGALVVGKSTSGTVYDTIGWGAATSGYEGAVIPGVGRVFSRRQVSGQLVDTDQNAADFAIQSGSCGGVEFNEIQPYVTDETGGAIAAWVELRGAANPAGDCMLVGSTGDAYLIGAESMPAADQLAVIDGAVDALGNSVPLHFGEINGQLWLADSTVISDTVAVYSPVTTATYSALARGQTAALIDGLWRRTYQPTPTEPNVYLAAILQPEVVSTACETVLITEVVPNPLGEDTGKEWLELLNSGTDMSPIGQCQVVVNGIAYGFLDDEVMEPGEYRIFDTFYTADVEPVALSLRNGEDNILGWQRAIAGSPPQLLQQLSYSDAPEGQSWSRYDVGWRWDDTPTPNSDNTVLPDAVETVPIEQAAPVQAPVMSADPGAENPAGTAPDAQRADIPVIITELLPNPAAPLNDDADEFVELYNQGEDTIALRGYKLQVGSNYAYTHTFTDEILLPHGYVVVTSGASSISLSNTSGRARLATASGEVVYETAAYDSAAAGAVWALVGGNWQWTYSATPALANVLTAAPVKAAKTTKATKTTAAKAKTTAAKAASTKAAKDKQTSAAKAASTSASGQAKAPPLHIAVLAAVGVLAVLYAAYEYRHDIANRIYQFRQYRKNRQINRQAVERW